MSNLDNLAQIDELNCSVCQETYGDEDRNPRNLPCGHTFCSHCLELILEDEDPLCPECRNEIPIARVNTFPISYVVKKMIMSYKDIYAKIQSQVLQSATEAASRSGQHADNGSSATSESGSNASSNRPYGCANALSAIHFNGSCSLHQSPKNLFCKTCGKWICGTCAFLNHRCKKCEVELVKEPVNFLKVEINKKITKQKIIMEAALGRLIKFKKRALNLYSNGKAPSNLVCTINKIIKKVEKNQREIRNSCELLDDVEEMFQVNTLAETKKLSKYVDNLWECQQYPKSEKDFFFNLWPLIKQSIECFDSKVINTCVTTELNGKTFFAKIFDVDEFILISSFQEAPPDGYTFPIDLKHIKTTENLSHSFMEFCRATESNYLGRVIFSVRNSTRGRQFLNLCAGTLGPCYKGTHFFRKMGNYVRFIEGGDYEKDNGEGGKQVLDITETETCELEEGVVCGHERHMQHILSQFKICYEIRKEYYHEAMAPIATIVEGLEIIQDIAEMAYQDVYISECGLCIEN